MVARLSGGGVETIVRRVHPPALDDGLTVALTSLATRSGMLVDVRIELRSRPRDAAATTLYFTAGELLANAARHAGAGRVGLHLTEDDTWIRLAVTDDGRGGAAPSHTGSGLAGLAGLARRARALDGRLDIVSPNRRADHDHHDLAESGVSGCARSSPRTTR